MGMLQGISDFVQRRVGSEPIDFEDLMAAHRAAQLAEFLPYRVYDPVRELFINDDSYGFSLEVMPMSGISTQRADVLRSALSRNVPDDVSVQLMLYQSPKIGTVLKLWGQARAGASAAHELMTKNRIKFLSDGVFNSLSKTSSFMPRYHRVIVSVSAKIPKGTKEQNELETELQEYKASLTSAMQQCAGYVREMDEGDLIRLCSDILNPTTSVRPSAKQYDPSTEINRQIIETDTTYLVNRDGVETIAIREADPARGDHYLDDNHVEERMEMRALEVRHFPRRVRFGAMAAILGDFFTNEIRFSSPCWTVLNVHFPKAEPEKLKFEQKAMRARQVAEGPSGRYMVSMRTRAEELDSAQKAIVEGFRPVKVSMFCIVLAPKGQIRKAERTCRNVFNSCGYEMRRCDMVHMPTVIASLPMTGEAKIGRDIHTLRRSHSQISNVVVPCAPIFGEFMGYSLPVMLLMCRRGQPFYWGPFASEGEGNMNVAIAAPSGGGKSFLLSELLFGHTGTGGHAVVIDDGESFKTICEMLGGTHYNFKLTEGFCMNPFPAIDPVLVRTDEDYLGERIEICRAIYAQMCFGDELPSKEENGILTTAIMSVWQTYGREGQTDHVHNFLKTYETQGVTNTKSMANAMLPYCSDGPYGRIFNGENNLDLSNRLTVFELSPLEQKPDLRGIIVTALFALIDAKTVNDRTRSDMIIIDEAWKLLLSDTLCTTLAGWARRVRKYNGSLVMATQGIDDFARTESAKSVQQNCEWTLFLKGKESGVQLAEKMGIISGDYLRRIAKDLKVSPGEYSEVLITRGTGSYAVGRLAVDPFTQALFSTTADDVALLDRLKREGVPLGEAIEQLVEYRSR